MGGRGRVWVHAALFHPRTPLVADSTAVAASQSPLAICPVTLHHHRGQRALCLPINGPRSASVSPSPNSHNSAGGRNEAEAFGGRIFSGCPPAHLRPSSCSEFASGRGSPSPTTHLHLCRIPAAFCRAKKRGRTLQAPRSPGGNCSPL